MRNAILPGRVDLVDGDAPKLQLVLACLDQRIGLRARKGIVRLAKPIAVLLSQAIFLDGRCSFRTVNIGHRLAALHSLPCVLHIELVHAASDPCAHGSKLRLRLLHAAKCVNVRLERCGANLGNLHAGGGDLGRAQFNRGAGLRTRSRG